MNLKNIFKKKKSHEKKVIHLQNQFNNNEVYRQLRTNIEFSSIEKKTQVISVTSSSPDEGKTTTSTNLALISTAKYKNVLLIDCDLRKPSIHRAFKISNKQGLSNLLLENVVDINDGRFFHRFTTPDMIGKLYVLSAGVKVPNPQELLSSNKFKELVDELRKSFDFIVIDCPPILAVSDAIPVGNVSDGTVFVVSAKDTNKKAAKDALTQLKRSGVRVIGSVLSKVDLESESYYYYDYN